ncbi:MAG: AAA family ATPase [Sedimentisphaerales bacterium]|nr:AAA family ATPase [Sedimentisphaerales bacterium]
MEGLKIAIGGKGGVGKTTVCAFLAQIFAQDGFDVLAIDADPNTTLAMAFGIPSDQNPEPLINLKELIAERTGTQPHSIGSYFRLNPKVSDLPEKYWLEVNKIKLLVLGAITHGGSGCACPEGAFLKAMLRHIILQRKELALIDLAAGVEFLGRASILSTDMLILVVEPGGRSIETANNMGKMAKELGIKHVTAIANKITKQTQVDLIRDQLKNIKLLGHLDFSEQLIEADIMRKDVFSSDQRVLTQLKEVKVNLENILNKTSLEQESVK